MASRCASRTRSDSLAELEASGFTELSVAFRHAKLAGRLEDHHRDPFDRLLVAQAEIEGLVIITRDGSFEPYGVAIVKA